MRKVLYITRILLSSFRKKLALIWLITLIVSFGLSMSIGIVQGQLQIQSHYLKDDMRDLAFLVDAETDYYADNQARGASTQRVRAKLSQWPGLRAVYEQTTVEVPDKGWVLLGYPAELLSRLHLPTAEKNTEMDPDVYENPIWLDYSLRSEYQTGDTISLRLLVGGEKLCHREFTVAGFLNRENVHYDFQSGSSVEAYSADFVVQNPSYIVCIAVSDVSFAEAEFDGSRSCAKFLLPEAKENISVWKRLARQQGIGHVSSMEDILENDRKNIDLMSTPILVLCGIMLVLTLIGLIGTQLQLMNLYRQTAFSLVMTGMSWGAWKASWLSVFCLPLWAASLIGASLGSAWKRVILLQGSSIFTPSVFAVSIAVVLLSAIGILPTIGRWSRIDIHEFRRLCE